MEGTSPGMSVLVDGHDPPASSEASVLLTALFSSNSGAVLHRGRRVSPAAIPQTPHNRLPCPQVAFHLCCDKPHKGCQPHRGAGSATSNLQRCDAASRAVHDLFLIWHTDWPGTVGLGSERKANGSAPLRRSGV